MKLSIDVTRIPAPAIAALGTLNAFSVQPDSTAFILSLALTTSGLLLTFDDVHELACGATGRSSRTSPRPPTVPASARSETR